MGVLRKFQTLDFRLQTFSVFPDSADLTIASVTATPWTISLVGIGYAGPPCAARAKASSDALVTSSRSASHTLASPFAGWNLQVPNSRVRRSSDEAPATCVIPSRRTHPFDPNTWKLKPG